MSGADAGNVIFTRQVWATKTPTARMRANAGQLIHLIIDNLAVAILITQFVVLMLENVTKEFDVLPEVGSNYLPRFFVIIFSIKAMLRLIFMTQSSL